jgi:branched-chain amino acid transport system permease protein
MIETSIQMINNFRNPQRYIPLIGIAILIFAPLTINNAFYQDVIFTAFLFAVLAASWNILGGFAGQTSLGNTAFFGIGAYISTQLYLQFGISPWIGMIAGAAVAIIVGIGIGVPCFRFLKTHFFALATIAFATILHIMAVYFRDLTNGTVGLVIPFKEGWQYMMFHNKLTYVYISIAMMISVILISFAISRSKFGFYLNAVREDQDAAEALGVNTTWYKIRAFIVSIFFSSACGTLYAQYMRFIDPDSLFSFQISINMALFSIIGGLGTILGPILGAVALTPLDILLRGWFGPQFAGLNLIIYGAILIIVVRFLPHGIIGLISKKYDRLITNLPGYNPNKDINGYKSSKAEKLVVYSQQDKKNPSLNLLEVKGLSKKFGGLKAVENLDFEIRQGEVVGLIGPNGAGKTTVFNLLSGFIQPDSGEVWFNGKIITGAKPPHKLCPRMIGRTFQIVRPFPNMTVLENVMVGAFARTTDGKKARKIALDIISFCELEKYKDYRAINLTIADRKRLEMSRTLAGFPELLLADEVMAGLTPSETNEIIQLMKKISGNNITILLIEHVMKAVMSLSDKIIVLNYGNKIAEGSPANISKNKKVIDAYLGEEYVA